MRRLPLLLGLLLPALGGAGAQITAPAVTVTPAPPPAPPELARRVLIQPERLEARLLPGYTTGTLNVTLFSEVPTEVVVESSDPRLVLRGAEEGVVRLGAYVLQSLNFVALGAHAGTITVRNRGGAVVATAPYVVAPAKTLNQSASLSYSPGNARGFLSYSVSNNPASSLDPRVNLSVSAGLNTATGQVGGNVSIGVSW